MTTVTKQRLMWPDAAKGFCIMLVVLVHMTSKNYLDLGWDEPRGVELAWSGLSEVLTPIRMPLFFAISGYFVAKYVSRPWSEVWGKRVAAPYYLYIVWFLLHSAFFLLDFPLRTGVADSPEKFAIGLVFGFTSLWYLYALPVYFVIARLFIRWRVQALVGAALLSTAASILGIGGNPGSLVKHLVFFMAAAYFPHLIKNWADRTSHSSLAWMAGGFMVLSTSKSIAAYYLADQGLSGLSALSLLGAADLLLGILGVATGVAGFAWASRSLPLFTKACAYLGKRTLPVYVLHLPVLAVLNWLLFGTTPTAIVILVYPFLTLPAVIFVCLAIHRFLILVRANWLFSTPWTPQSSTTRTQDSQSIAGRG